MLLPRRRAGWCRACLSSWVCESGAARGCWGLMERRRTRGRAGVRRTSSRSLHPDRRRLGGGECADRVLRYVAATESESERGLVGRLLEPRRLDRRAASLRCCGAGHLEGRCRQLSGHYGHCLGGHRPGQLLHVNSSAAPLSAAYCVTWARDGASLSSFPSSWLEKGEKLQLEIEPNCKMCGIQEKILT